MCVRTRMCVVGRLHDGNDFWTWPWRLRISGTSGLIHKRCKNSFKSILRVIGFPPRAASWERNCLVVTSLKFPHIMELAFGSLFWNHSSLKWPSQREPTALGGVTVCFGLQLYNSTRELLLQMHLLEVMFRSYTVSVYTVKIVRIHVNLGEWKDHSYHGVCNNTCVLTSVAHILKKNTCILG